MERLLDVAGLTSPARYRRLLTIMLRYYRPIESHLAAFDWTAHGLDFDERRKTPLLVADLCRMGSTPADVESLADARVPRPATFAGAIGCAYVLEGATLGGVGVAKRLRLVLDVGPGSGGDFFTGYGPRTHRMWQRFVEALNLSLQDAERQREAVKAACAAFEHLEALFRDQKSAWVLHPAQGET
jgi:heme oxygenase